MSGDASEIVLESIGANVRRERVRLEMTQEMLAERADLDLRFLQRLERGKSNLSVRTLCSLAAALQLPPAQLFEPATIERPRRGRPPKA